MERTQHDVFPIKTSGHEEGDRKTKDTNNVYLLRFEPRMQVNDHWMLRSRIEGRSQLHKDTSGDLALKRAWAEGTSILRRPIRHGVRAAGDNASNCRAASLIFKDIVNRGERQTHGGLPTRAAGAVDHESGSPRSIGMKCLSEKKFYAPRERDS